MSKRIESAISALLSSTTWCLIGAAACFLLRVRSSVLSIYETLSRPVLWVSYVLLEWSLRMCSKHNGLIRSYFCGRWFLRMKRIQRPLFTSCQLAIFSVPVSIHCLLRSIKRSILMLISLIYIHLHHLLLIILFTS